MAIAEYVVIMDVQRQVDGNIARTWNGAAAGAGIKDFNVKSAKYLVVEAESVEEAVKGARQLYGGNNTGKVVAVAKSAVTEIT